MSRTFKGLTVSAILAFALVAAGCATVARVGAVVEATGAVVEKIGAIVTEGAVTDLRNGTDKVGITDAPKAPEFDAEGHVAK